MRLNTQNVRLTRSLPRHLAVLPYGIVQARYCICPWVHVIWVGEVLFCDRWYVLRHVRHHHLFCFAAPTDALSDTA